jgi:pimeloyl-ACP methyl ester carboxylesterase
MTTLTDRQAGLVIASLAAGLTAGWVAQSARRAERTHPPVGSFVDVDSVRLHYVEQGDGPVVVLLHGNAVPLQDIVASGLVSDLSARHRVIVFDRPGFGFSERPRSRMWTARNQADLIDKALRRIGVDSAVVMGHSWGTLVALELGLLEDSVVRKLVLVSGYYFPNARLDVALAAPPAIPLLGDVMRYTISPIMARLMLGRTVRKMFAPEPVPSDYLDAVPRALMVRPSQIRASSEEGVFMIPGAMRVSKGLGSLDVPTVLLAGTHDKIVDHTKQSIRMHREMPRSTLELVPGAGHMLHHAHHRRVADAIAD